MDARMKIFLVFIILCAIACTIAAIVNYKVPNCDCVFPKNCLDGERSRFKRCGSTGLVCCEKVYFETTEPPTEVPPLTTNFTKISLNALTGTGVPEVFDTQKCGIGATQFNIELKEFKERENAKENEFPWILEIFLTDGSKHYPDCVAVLADYRLAITAAHCVIDLVEGDIVVRAGDYNLETKDELFKHKDSKVLKIITHPEYTALGNHNNIALLILEGFNPSINIRKICLPEPGDDFSTNSYCFTAGWGSLSDIINPNELQVMKKVRQRLITSDDCNKKLRNSELGESFELSKSSLCAVPLGDGRDTGLGFGGAPLFCLVEKEKKEDNHFTLVGITTGRAQNSLPGAPGIYTAFFEFQKWVENASMEFFLQLMQ